MHSRRRYDREEAIRAFFRVKEFLIALSEPIK